MLCQNRMFFNLFTTRGTACLQKPFREAHAPPSKGRKRMSLLDHRWYCPTPRGGRVLRGGRGPRRTESRVAWLAPDGIASCVGAAARAGRDSPLRGRAVGAAGRNRELRGFLGRCRTGIAFAWPRRTGIAFAWENDPRNSRFRPIRPRNSRFRPIRPRNCKSHPVPSEKTTQLAIPSGSAGRGRHAGGGRTPSSKVSASRPRRRTPRTAMPAPHCQRGSEGSTLRSHSRRQGI